MNIQRIVRVASCLLFLTGYQIYWYNHKKSTYHLTVFGAIYYLTLFILYLICFCHHFESSSVLKIIQDLSPFLNHLIRLQVLLGLKVFIIQIIESKNLRKISISLVHTFDQEIELLQSFDIFEVLVYLMLFSTLLIALIISIYIAIELQFNLPPLDHIMIYMALFMPHFSLAGCLRLYTLGLWIMKRDLFNLETNFKQRRAMLELSNNHNELHINILQRLDSQADFLKLFDNVLQRQLSILVGLNLNCLLTAVYCYVNYENTWKVLFTNQTHRIFYAATGGICVCILADYGILLFSCLSFTRVKRKLYNTFEAQLFGNNRYGLEMQAELKNILYKLSNKFKLKLFGLVDFNLWNFVIFQGLLVLIVALIVSHQYLNDQIKMINERFND